MALKSRSWARRIHGAWHAPWSHDRRHPPSRAL